MRQLTIPTLALTAIAAVGAASQAVEQTSLGLSAVRYWRPAAGQTVVDVFARIPVAAVSALGAEGSDGAFRFAVVVQDSSGLRLLSQAWTETVGDAILRVRGASVGEHLTFAARAGRYTVEAVVTDSASGRVARQQITVEAFAAPPAASDLLLGTGLRGLEDSTVRSGEIRKGGVAVQTSGEPVLTPQAAKLGYYLELYPARAETLTVSLRVLTAAGSPVIAAPSERLPVGAGGAVTHEIVDLTGLPPGRYRLEVTAGGRVDTVRRTAGFGMSGFETAATAEAMNQPEDRFGRMTEAQLDEVYAPLIYLMTSAEQGTYSSLSVDGKRRWLRQFWAKRDPTAGTARNEAQERFYSLIAEANRRFREGGQSAVPGWRTDRGRIYIKYGPPDEVLERRQAGSTSPYEVWKYTRTRLLKYVFMDLTRFGNYQLIFTDDRREPSRSNWMELLGEEGVQDVQRF